MRDAVIVAAVRTPLGKRNGALSTVHPVTLSAHVLTELAARSGVDPAEIDDVAWGVVGQAGEQAADLARTAVLAAGWPESVTGYTIDRQCGSSQQAVHSAAAGLIAGQYDLVVAGGVESMSRVPMGFSTQGKDPYGELYLARYGAYPNQGIGAEMIAESGGSPGPSSTSSRSPATRRPPRPGPRAGSTPRSLRSRWRTGRSWRATRESGLAGRSRVWRS